MEGPTPGFAGADIGLPGGQVTLRFHRLRLWLRARRGLWFPPGVAANRVRGGLGAALRRLSCRPDCESPEVCPHGRRCLYGQVFSPSEAAGPSGLRDRPRPFTLRPPAFDGRRIAPGALFPVDVHLFDARAETMDTMVAAFADLAVSLAGEWGAAELVRAETLELDESVRGPVFEKGTPGAAPAPVTVSLDGPAPRVERLRVEFVSPVELKGGDFSAEAPAFAVLLCRARDRVSNLIRLYGEADDAAGLEGLDFGGLGERARGVRCVEARLRRVEAFRRSGRTGQRHELGGLVGKAVYEGELGEFVPWLEAAQWTGVGRQTVWGKGVFLIQEMK